MNVRSHPWLTEQSINFLENYLSKNKNLHILEFGCGASTIWFSKYTNNLVSIEHDERWYNKIKEHTKGELHLIKSNYYQICEKFPDEYFDLILVDGTYRIKCVESCIRILKKGGIMMLDNAERDRYAPIYKLLENWKIYRTTQTKPDMYGSYYENWQTNWWIKPD